MAKRENYNDLIFQLGDLARERLANSDRPPRSMDRVFKAEDAVVKAREELAALEQQLNDEDEGYKDFLEQQVAERAEQKEIVTRWKRAVEGIEGRTVALRKQLSSKKAALRYEKVSLKRAEDKHKDLEFTQHHDQAKIAMSRENLKKMRLIQMRKQREIEEIEMEFNAVLTPKPGQPGAAGILAHKRLIEMEDEAEDRKVEHEQAMKDLDAAIALKEEEVKASEDYLDQALFLLGEECYQLRINDPALAALYPRLDNAE